MGFAALAVAGFLLGIAAVAFGSPSANGLPEPLWTTFVFFPAASAFPIVGALIATRQPRNAVGWILLAFGVMGAVSVPAALYADHHFAHHEGQLPADNVAAWGSDWVGSPGRRGSPCTPSGSRPTCSARASGLSRRARRSAAACAAICTTASGPPLPPWCCNCMHPAI